MKALITGITSFHGGHIARELVSKGYEVHGLLRHVANRSFKIDGVTMHKGDVTDYQSVSSILNDINPQLIVHLAAQSPVEYSFTHEKEVMDVNYLGTFNMAHAAHKQLKSLYRFTLASSVEVYGNQPHVPLTEDMPPNPASPYGVAKVAAETYVRYLSRGYGFPGIILRTANTYGRDQTDYFVIERIIHNMLLGKKEIHMGLPYPIRDFLYVDDELTAYMNIIESRSIKPGETFNTGTCVGISIEDLFNLIKTKIGSDAIPIWRTNSPRPYEINNLTVSYNKLYEATGWVPQYDLNSGLERTIRKWRDQL